MHSGSRRQTQSSSRARHSPLCHLLLTERLRLRNRESILLAAPWTAVREVPQAARQREAAPVLAEQAGAMNLLPGEKAVKEQRHLVDHALLLVLVLEILVVPLVSQLVNPLLKEVPFLLVRASLSLPAAAVATLLSQW